MRQQLDVIEIGTSQIECAVSRASYRICPITHEADAGVLEVCWRTTDYTVVMLSLGTYLDTWATVEITCEDLVAQIFQDLTDVGVEPVEVVWHGQTSGMPFMVRRAEPAVLAQAVDRPRSIVVD